MGVWEVQRMEQLIYRWYAARYNSFRWNDQVRDGIHGRNTAAMMYANIETEKNPAKSGTWELSSQKNNEPAGVSGRIVVSARSIKDNSFDTLFLKFRGKISHRQEFWVRSNLHLQVLFLYLIKMRHLLKT